MKIATVIIENERGVFEVRLEDIKHSIHNCAHPDGRQTWHSVKAIATVNGVLVGRAGSSCQTVDYPGDVQATWNVARDAVSKAILEALV